MSGFIQVDSMTRHDIYIGIYYWVTSWQSDLQANTHSHVFNEPRLPAPSLLTTCIKSPWSTASYFSGSVNRTHVLNFLAFEMRFNTFILTCTVFLGQVHCWGTLGHTTVALIASNLVSLDTKVYFQTLLKNETDSYLANVATWADSFRYTAAGRFSAPFHFIDAADNPPLSCGVRFVRDCGEEGCIVGAIQNYVGAVL